MSGRSEGEGVSWGMLLDVKEQSVFVLDQSAGEPAVVATHREALLVLRPRLATVEIDPTSPPWPLEVSRQVQALHRLGERQGRWPPRNRPLARTGVDLDPRNDAEFEVLITLSPHTLLADGWDEDGRNIYSASDEGGLWLRLTADEHAEVSRRLSEIGVGEAVLGPQPPRAPLWRDLFG
jgi:hypothetical protein